MATQTQVLVYNLSTKEFGIAVAIEASPYVIEELAGIERVRVWAEVPGAAGVGYGWNWWLIRDTVRITDVTDDSFSIAALAA